MPTDNGAIVRRWFNEVWNERRVETIDELIECDAVCYTDEASIRGPDEFKQMQYEPLVAAFPDVRVEIEAMIVQGDDVVVRWSATGTHTGEGLGVAPTGQAATFHGISWTQVRDGRLHQGWQSSNIPQVLAALVAAASAEPV